MISELPIASAPPTAVERLEDSLLRTCAQVECRVNHYFAPGVYVREILMPSDKGRGLVVIGHEHKTEHLNIVSIGRAFVMMDGVLHHIIAPCTFKSMPGVRKVLFIYEDMIWQTVHPTDETDIQKLTELLIVKSQSYLKYAEDIRLLQKAAMDAACIKGDS